MSILDLYRFEVLLFDQIDEKKEIIIKNLTFKMTLALPALA